MSTTLHSFIDIFDMQFSDTDPEIQLKKIVIPIIQRDYAQGRDNPEVKRVRTRFLKALYDAVNGDPITLDFVYGNIDKDGTLEPLDGQQRLTTLFLLHWYAAKKDRVPESEWGFLKGFSYYTRVSARDFCADFVRFEPSFDRSIREDIINQSWFPLEWKKDPTIDSMLNMLDAIDAQFKDVNDLWSRLKEGAITFYLLPIKDMDLTDDLYIKMNSRGKPLTQFEHFKAELEKEMEAVDPETAKRIISKFDREWMDLLWRYRNSGDGDERDYTTDDEFLRYFQYVCDVICFKNGESPQTRSNDELDLIQLYFSPNNPDACDNMKLLEESFDCWCDIPGYDSPEAFLESFMTEEGHEKGKIYVDSATLLQDCLSTYSEMSGKRRLFPLNQFVLLYAVNFYLQHQEDIDEEAFIRRIRIINNLIKNSEDEIVDRTDRNRITPILEQTEEILLTGLIDDNIENSFNVNQIEEEKKKIEHLEKKPEDRETLFKLEDDEMLYGQVGIIGLDHLDLTDKFIALFENDWDKVDCALMATGKYIQQENTWRYQAGSSRLHYAWYELFHKSRNKGFENTSIALITLLERLDQVSNETLDSISESFIKAHESDNSFPWEYYYVKYPAFRPGKYGKLSGPKDGDNSYMFAVLQTKARWSENTYMPYLMEADPDHIDKDDNGQSLQYKDHYIFCDEDAFVVRNNENEDVDKIEIRQNSEGIDVEDRIIKLKEYINAHPDL